MQKWLQPLIDKYLAQVERRSDSPEDRAIAQVWADWMTAWWDAYGTAELKQQCTLITDVQNAIKQRTGKERLALEATSLSPMAGIEMNRPNTQQFMHHCGRSPLSQLY